MSSNRINVIVEEAAFDANAQHKRSEGSSRHGTKFFGP